MKIKIRKSDLDKNCCNINEKGVDANQPSSIMAKKPNKIIFITIILILSVTCLLTFSGIYSIIKRSQLEYGPQIEVEMAKQQYDKDREEFESHPTFLQLIKRSTTQIEEQPEHCADGNFKNVLSEMGEILDEIQSFRIKRELNNVFDYDHEVVYEKLLREKRFSEIQLQRKKDQFTKCKENENDFKKCQEYYDEFKKIADDIGKKFGKMMKLLNGISDGKSQYHDITSSEEAAEVLIPETGDKYTIFIKNNKHKNKGAADKLPTTTCAAHIAPHSLKPNIHSTTTATPSTTTKSTSVVETTPKFQNTPSHRTTTEVYMNTTTSGTLNISSINSTSETPLSTLPIHTTESPELRINEEQIMPDLQGHTIKKGQAAIQEEFLNEFSSQSVPPPTYPNPVHEELFDRPDDSKLGRNLESSKLFLHERFNTYRQRINEQNNLMQNNLKDMNMVGASGPFLTLCDQVLKQTQINKDKITTLNNQNQQPIFFGPQMQVMPHQFTSRGIFNQPMSGGDSIKGTAQVIVNPGFSYMPYPMCFVMAPMNHPIPNQSRNYQFGFPTHNTMSPMQYGEQTTHTSHPQNSGGPVKFDIDPRFGGYVVVPTQLQSITTSSGFQVNQQNGRNSENSANQNQQYFCSYLPSNTNTDMEHQHLRTSVPYGSQTDLIYASYGNHLYLPNNATMSNFQNYCMDNEYPCATSNNCVPTAKWCDSKVDCPDASDETSCSCKSRLAETKICDGYLDCPMGDDEIGCFGCDTFSYSCYKSETEYKAAKMSSLSMCYTILEKCDGYQNCLNGQDEAGCTMISKSVGHHLSYMVSYTEGFLHRNHKGKWYPVCRNPMNWARESCMHEMGAMNIPDPLIFYKTSQMLGPFIDYNEHLANLTIEPNFADQCPGQNGDNALVYVKCPPLECGLSTAQPMENSVYHDESQDGRIVGGHISDPTAWPFTVAIYQNGSFHCGGVIYSEWWILSAAHCFSKAYNSYYEIRAGMNRRLSYSPMVQINFAELIYIHDGYDRNAMSNDLGLIKLAAPLIFNKWVQPICMPGPNRTTHGDDWIWGPKGGTYCTTVGWGSTREKGVDSDHLQEVSIPIISQCKHKKDQEGEGICAGHLEGGHDACQGDSGGPLFCKSLNSPLQHYLAGIVSHGEGCGRANEPGVYTRVALFLDFIKDCTEKRRKPTYRPLVYCPGKICVWGGGYCISPDFVCDRIVDCLGGEDEIDCRYDEYILGAAPNVTTVIDDDTENVHENNTKPVSSPYFKCTNIAQNINADLRCNYDIDCEDGTDEENCTCREYLQHMNSHFICDGVLECRDGTDELDCAKCSHDEFLCGRSQTCIKNHLHCDQNYDCPHKEDEMDCLALTDGQTITFDADQRPISLHYGFVSINTNGTWNVLCLADGDIKRETLFDSTQATKICHQIGYSDYHKFNLTQDETLPSRVKHLNSTLVDETKSIEIDSSASHHCMSLYLECIPNFMMNLTQIEEFIKLNVKHSRNYENFENYEMSLQPEKYPNVILLEHQKKRSNLSEILYNFPWNSEIYVDGKLFCNAILIGQQWIISENICMGLINLKLDHVMVLVGGSLAGKNLEGPHEQLRRIDCLKNVEGSNIILLRMEKPIEYSRYRIPMHIPKAVQNVPNSNHPEECLAVSFNSRGKMKTMPVVEVAEQCAQNVICFQGKGNKTCDDEESQSAIVLCRNIDVWYPKAIYSHRHGLCAFKNTVRLVPFMKFHDKVFEITNSTDCKYTHAPPVCKGHRCPLGKCLAAAQICDGNIDCRDRSDESKDLCSKAKEIKCTHGEFRCGNGKCVAKQLFCNKHDDCGDQTDEPKECSCFTFLNATDPGKICDGIRNCYDKSDEPRTCKCQKNSYRCGRTEICIPMEYVCDGEFDCPEHEDEKYCTALLQNHNTKNDGDDDFHEVMHQSYGVWHTQCFPKSAQLNITQIENICESLGHIIKPVVANETLGFSKRPQYRIVENNILKSAQNDTNDQKLTDATKMVVVNRLSALNLNKDFLIFMKPSRPFGKVINWDHEDQEKCYRIEIRCQ